MRMRWHEEAVAAAARLPDTKAKNAQDKHTTMLEQRQSMLDEAEQSAKELETEMQKKIDEAEERALEAEARLQELTAARAEQVRPCVLCKMPVGVSVDPPACSPSRMV